MSDDDYTMMIERTCRMLSKDPTVDLTIIERPVDGNKENKNEEHEKEQEKVKLKGKKVHGFLLTFLVDWTHLVRHERILQCSPEMWIKM